MASKSLKAAVKTLCIVLVMAFVVTGILFIGKAFAAGEPTPPPEQQKTQDLTGESTSSPEQQKSQDLSSVKGVENVAKREFSNKYYKLENGITQAVMFGYPVHYLDNGKYVDIDNSLTLMQNKDGKDVYTNKANNFKVEISPNSDLTGISKDKYRLIWSIDGISKKATGSVKSSLTKQQWESQNEMSKRTTVPNIGSFVTYKDVLSNIDLNIGAVSNTLKENIVINSLTDISTIVEPVRAENLKLVKNEDGSIIAEDQTTGDKIFVLPQPYMYDANGDICDIDVVISLSGDTYTLTYTLDRSWLKSAAYPVVVDPTVTVPYGTSAIDDGRVSQAHPSNNYSTSVLMCTGYGSTSKVDRSYVRFNQLPGSGLFTASQIYGAHFTATTYSSFSDSSTVWLYKVTGSWNASTIIWNNKPSYDTSSTTSCSLYLQGPSSANAAKTWNGNGVSAGLTQLVRGWYTTNYGLVMKDADESSSSNFYKTWYTWNNGQYGPMMIIDYDNVAPYAPSSVSIDTSSGNTNTTPTVSWSGITDDGGSSLANAQYSIDGGTYVNIPTTSGISSGSYSIDMSGYNSGDHTIYIRGIDNVGNTGSPVSVAYYKYDYSIISATSNVNYATRLRWPVYLDGVFEVQRKTDNGSYSTVAGNLSHDTVEWSDTNIVYGATYTYRVIRRRSGYPDQYSQEVSGTFVSENEINKQIGNKGYQQFTGFDNSSGNGNINPSSGNLFYTTTDATRESPMGTLSLVRYYNSQASYSTNLGQGWDFNYNIILLKELNSSQQETAMLLKLGDGSIYRFSKNQNGTYTSPNGLFATLVYNSGTQKYTLTTKDKTQYLFNIYNRIEKITDRKGNYLQFNYTNGDGNLISIVDSVANRLTFTYNYALNVAKEINTIVSSNSNLANSSKTYTYAYLNGMLSKSYILITIDDQQQQYGEQYTYTNNLLTTIKSTDGHDYIIGYNTDTPKKVTLVTNPLNQNMTIGYSMESGDLVVTTCLNNVTQKYCYDSSSLVLKKQQFENEDPTVYTYNSNYQITGKTYPNDTTESYNYTNGNIATFTNADGKVTSYIYGTGNNDDLPVQISEPFNGTNYKVTINTYDNYGNLTDTYIHGMSKYTTYTYNSFGQVLTQTDTITSGNNTYTSVTSRVYDTYGRLTQTTNPDNTTVTQTYDDYNNVTETTDANNAVTETTSDILGRSLRITCGVGTSSQSTSGVSYEANNIKSKTDGNGNVTTNTYDVLGRITGTVNPDNTSTTTSYQVNSDGTQVKRYVDEDGNEEIAVTNKKGQTILEGMIGNTSGTNNSTTTANQYTYDGDVLIQYVRYSYDVMGNEVWEKSNTGVETTKEYDELNRLTSVTVTNGSLSQTTTYVYDDAGNVLQEIAPDITTISSYDKQGRRLSKTITKNNISSATTYTYDGVDSNSHLQTTITDPLNRQKTLEYDLSNRLVKETNQGKTTVYTYDGNGNMLTSTLTDTAFSGQSAETVYTYDSLNRISRVQYSPNYYIDYTYDDNGNKTQEKLTENGNVTNTIDYTYNAMNLKTEKEQNNVIIAQYTYSGTGSATSVKYGNETTDRRIGYTYDEDGKITDIADLTNGGNTILREYFYTDGLLNHIVDHRGMQEAQQLFTYDGLSRLTNVQYFGIVGSTVLEEYAITYNNENKIESEVTTTRYTQTPVVTTKEYAYDSLGRLISETVNNVQTSYTYDAAGNRLTMTNGLTTLTYNYNDYDELTSILNGNDTVYSCDYDLNGNQITKTEGTTITTYSFNPANLLTSVTQQVGQGTPTTLASYDYDATNQRIQKTVGTAVTNYYYSDLNLLYTKDGSGIIIEQNVLEPDGSMVQSRRADESNYWYRQDVRGSVTNIVNNEDSVVKSYTYNVYGNTVQGGSFVNSFAYSGAVIDNETGLYYMNARYYDSQTGRFISMDTYRGEGESYWNLYAFCNGDPVNYSDISGHSRKRIGIAKRRRGNGIFKDAHYSHSWHNWLGIRTITVEQNASFYVYQENGNWNVECVYAKGYHYISWINGIMGGYSMTDWNNSDKWLITLNSNYKYIEVTSTLYCTYYAPVPLLGITIPIKRLAFEVTVRCDNHGNTSQCAGNFYF